MDFGSDPKPADVILEHSNTCDILAVNSSNFAWSFFLLWFGGSSEKSSWGANPDRFLFCPKIPRSPDLFLIFPPVIVPSMEVFFSDGVLCGVVVLLVPEPLSTVDRSSKGISPGGRNPLLYFSTTNEESSFSSIASVRLCIPSKHWDIMGR